MIRNNLCGAGMSFTGHGRFNWSRQGRRRLRRTAADLRKDRGCAIRMAWCHVAVARAVRSEGSEAGADWQCDLTSRHVVSKCVEVLYVVFGPCAMSGSKS